MLDVIKFVFFIVAAIFFVSYVQENSSILNSTSSYGVSGNGGTAAYTRSYDSNADGTITDTEYRQGELDRIQNEVTQIAKAVQKALDEQNRSVYYDKITLGYGNVYTENSREEFITIEANYSNTAPIVISGWKLESLLSGTRVTVPKGVAILEGDRPWRNERSVFLAAGEKAIVNSRYAVGINTGFLENKCAGYLDRKYHFTPSISQSCPRLEDEDLASFGIAPREFDEVEDYEACMDAIESTFRCERGSYDSDVPRTCRTFINEYSTYDGCVELHKTDADFLGKTWRLFLGSSKDLWRSQREAIALIDDVGKVVDVLEF